MHNDDDTKNKQPQDSQQSQDSQEAKGKAWERGNDGAPRRRRGPYGPIRNGRYAQRTPRNPG